MKKGIYKLTIATGICYALVACGGAEKKAEEMQEDSMEQMDESDHSDHDHDAMMEEAEGSDLLPVPENAKVYFANLKDGQKVKSPVKVEFGLEGMEVEPAGELHEGMGHHHIIINGSALERGVAVPADSVNIHYGAGQTETELELPKGEHSLTMQFADGYHQSYGPQMSATIKITVE